MTSNLTHWDKIYQNQNHSQVSWHQDRATISFDWIINNAPKNSAIIDVGSGASVLADNLLEAGYVDLSLLEISPIAIQAVQKRLNIHAEKLTFYNENVLNFQSKVQFDVWHDRAVFHFLTDPKDQQTYLKKLNQQLKKEGLFLLATFSPEGPSQCSELDVVQYDVEKITHLLGGQFKLLKTTTEMHPRPNGETQHFNYFLFKKN
ncbi:class I SAM-dependent methyltransferase [Candidatus Thioglobus sp.]|uniref:class I SAM-dependent methyltransferase n=1 Tax=Candidatus Thioglobus sp. TaxID=2026721 RepID=UPI003D0DFC88